MLAYFASLVCHAVVLAPLAYLPALFGTSIPPARATRQAREAVVLQASFVAAQDAAAQETQVFMKVATRG